MHWLPNLSAASATKSGFLTAAELIETLSAPDSSNLRISATVRTPPPTVKGMKQCSAVCATTSKNGFAIVRGRGDVEKAQFVGACRIIGPGGLDRISGVDQIDEIDTLDDTAVLDIEAGDDAVI